MTMKNDESYARGEFWAQGGERKGGENLTDRLSHKFKEGNCPKWFPVNILVKRCSTKEKKGTFTKGGENGCISLIGGTKGIILSQEGGTKKSGSYGPASLLRVKRPILKSRSPGG